PQPPPSVRTGESSIIAGELSLSLLPSPSSLRFPLLISSFLAPSRLFSPARMSRQITAKAHCSLSPSTAPASELQAINISSRRGEQQHLRPTTISARASSNELPVKQQRTSSNDNNELAISSHLHSSYLRRNSIGDKVGGSKFLKFEVAEQENLSETVQQIKEKVMNLARLPTISAPDDTDDESDDDDYVEPTS
ncbi:hypothetical protein H5410_026763, partial [Solanum commersonii]